MGKEEKTIDRRVQRTKKLLWGSLVALIIRKGYDSVTIQDIIDEANIGRSTFYSHYENKEQLLFSGQPHLIEMLFQSDHVDGKIDFIAVFKHAKENKDVAKALFGKQGGHILLRHISEVMTHNLKEAFYRIDPSKIDQAPMKRKFVIEATSAALVSLLSNWIEDDMQMSIEEIDSISQNILGAMMTVNDVR